jgi:preprotein translocase subunit SecA
VHVISTNDYLAQRDSDEMSRLFDFFGLGCGCVKAGMSDAERRAAYAQPICYVSGKEVVFDYLKDRLAGHGVLPARLSNLRAFISTDPAPRPLPLIPALHFAIVDEADSVMIDEARTPMILSREVPPVFPPVLLRWAMDAARALQPGQHYRISGARDLDLLPGALAQAPPLPADAPASWQTPAWREVLLRQALSALHLYHRDQHYILADDKVQIVDESTGRVMPDRSWEQGLHQLIETKEQVPLSHGRETLARLTYQRFFRRYYLVSGLTGTAAEASRELWSVYRLRVRRIPTHRPQRRARLPDRCLPDATSKWHAVAEAAMAAAARGQPVLVGTRSVEGSEQIAAELLRRGVPHVVLNARQDALEAEIVAEAGIAGRITVATNMAGRGTDIRPDAQALAAGGLHVILTEFHESPRVDRQLFGRSARQGQPGTVQAIVSLQDPLLKPQPSALKRLSAGDGRLPGLLLRWLVRRAQAQAERRAYRVRLQTLRHDRERHRLIGFAGRVT